MEITVADGEGLLRPSIRRFGVSLSGIVNPVVVIAVDVIANEPPEMLFVQRDDMIENRAAAASHPAFLKQKHIAGSGMVMGALI